MKKVTWIFWLAVTMIVAPVASYQMYYRTSPLYEVSLSDAELKQVKRQQPDLVVDKSARRIYVVKQGELAQYPDGSYISWPISLGKDPVGTKMKMGDEKTPEGLYVFTDHASASGYYGSLWLNYPSAMDAKRGKSAGLLSDDQHKAVVKAQRKGIRPPDKTPMGGQILIHGTNTKIPKVGIPLPSDSIARHIETDGCVGMSNQGITDMRSHMDSTSGKVLILP
jgi:murein L,D-transpeptidase YafK